MSHLVIRADSSAQIGMGHVMRSLALARAWRAWGGTATLLSCCEDDVAVKRFAYYGFDVLPIPRRHPDPSDFITTVDVLTGLARDHPVNSMPWLVTDGYFFTSPFHRAVREAGFPLLVIDDIADRSEYHADVLLNQNIGAEQFEYRRDPDTLLLAGPHWALLQPEFREHRRAIREVPARVRRVLVTFGGSDPDNLTLRALAAVVRAGRDPLDIVVVVGPSYPHRAAVQGIVAGTRFPIRLECDVNNMAELMEWADLAVCAAGSTCWELAAIGVPAVLVVAADNQRAIATGLAERAVAVNLGWHENVSQDRLALALARAVHDQEWRRQSCDAGRKLVDGWGAERVVGAMVRHANQRLEV